MICTNGHRFTAPDGRDSLLDDPRCPRCNAQDRIQADIEDAIAKLIWPWVRRRLRHREIRRFRIDQRRLARRAA